MKLLTSSFLAFATVEAGELSEYDRKVGAIVTSLVVDAGVMPLHWIYNQTLLEEIVGHTDPVFHYPPKGPYYNYSFGENTQYGQQQRVYLQSIAEHGFDPSAQQQAYYDFYGPKDAPCAVHASEFVPCPPASSNVTCCYWDDSTIDFVAHIQENQTCMKDFTCGSITDQQANALTHAMLAVASGGDDITQALTNTETLIRLTQHTDYAVTFGSGGARVLHHAIFNQTSARDSVLDAATSLLDVNRVHPNLHPADFDLGAGMRFVFQEANIANKDLTLQVVQSCDYPHNLYSGSHILYQVGDMSNVSEALVSATRQIIMAGGDQASRGIFVGSVLGAVGGVDIIPDDWKKKYVHYEEVFALAQKVAKASMSGASKEAL